MKNNHVAHAATIQTLSNVSRFIEHELDIAESKLSLSKDGLTHLRKAMLANREVTRLLDIARAYECVADRRLSPSEGCGDTERLPPRRPMLVK